MFGITANTQYQYHTICPGLGLALSGSGTHTCAHLITSTVSDLLLDAHGTWGAIIALAGHDRLHFDACGVLGAISTSTHAALSTHLHLDACGASRLLQPCSLQQYSYGEPFFTDRCCAWRCPPSLLAALTRWTSSTDRRYLPLLHSLSHITHTMDILHRSACARCALLVWLHAL